MDIKLCKNCKHFVPIDMCKSPNNGVSMIDGKGTLKFAEVNRFKDDKCGKSAKWFEERSKPFWKFWSK